MVDIFHSNHVSLTMPKVYTSEKLHVTFMALAYSFTPPFCPSPSSASLVCPQELSPRLSGNTLVFYKTLACYLNSITYMMNMSFLKNILNFKECSTEEPAKEPRVASLGVFETHWILISKNINISMSN